LVAAYRKLHAPDVAFLGIDTSENTPIVQAFLSAKGVPFSSALAGPDVARAFDVAFIPTTVVLDKRGIVRARWTGGVTPAQLAQYVAGARAGRSTEFISAEQRKVDALLTPSRFNFTGTPAARTASVARLDAATKIADKLANTDGSGVDFARTSKEA